MSEAVLREWRFYLDDMIGFAEKVLAYTEGFDQMKFVDIPSLLPQLHELRDRVQSERCF